MDATEDDRETVGTHFIFGEESAGVAIFAVKVLATPDNWEPPCPNEEAGFDSRMLFASKKLIKGAAAFTGDSEPNFTSGSLFEESSKFSIDMGPAFMTALFASGAGNFVSKSAGIEDGTRRSGTT